MERTSKVEGFNTSLSIMDNKMRQKINKVIGHIKDTINQLD